MSIAKAEINWSKHYFLPDCDILTPTYFDHLNWVGSTRDKVVPESLQHHLSWYVDAILNGSFPLTINSLCSYFESYKGTSPNTHFHKEPSRISFGAFVWYGDWANWFDFLQWPWLRFDWRSWNVVNTLHQDVITSLNETRFVFYKIGITVIKSSEWSKVIPTYQIHKFG